MKVDSILKEKGGNVVTIKPEAAVGMAVHRLGLENIGALLVVKGDALVGIISERDIVRALSKHKAETLELTVAELMTRELVTCTPSDSLSHMMRLMTRHRLRHLPVLVDGRLVGLISTADVVKYRLDELEMETSVLRDAYVASH